MTKAEFINALRGRLAQLPKEEIEKQISFYSEMIDDMTEDGLEEYEAVARLGNVSDIAHGILRDTPLPTLIRSRVRPGGGWTAVSIVLLVLGSPIWLSLLIAVFAVVLSVYVVIWAVILVLFAVVLSIALAAVALVAAGVLNIGVGLPFTMMILGGAAVCAGLTILAFFGAVYAAKGLVKLTAALAVWIKSLFFKKEG